MAGICGFLAKSAYTVGLSAFLGSTEHLAIDGGSSPLTASFLGIVVFWRSGSTLWRSVLEFVHLTQSHSGVYLAEKTLECLDRFGLRHHIISMCLDNTSNNDVLVRKLADVLPNFRGSCFRGRCLAHIVNLIAKAFMAVFTRPAPRKRKIAAIARAAAKRPANTTSGSTINTHDTSPAPAIDLTHSSTSNGLDEHDLPPPNELDIALEVPGELVDEGMEQHDTVEVQKGVGIAIETVSADCGLRLSESKLIEARELFPKIVGFANDVHGSGTLSAEFQELRNGCRDLLTTQKELPTQRVETRWGADRACAITHEELRLVIDIMTGKAEHKMAKYQLSTSQWGLLHEVIECLQVFDEPTRIHSQKNIPLIHLVLPHLRLLKYRLELMRDAVVDPGEQTPRLVTRVAALAALNVLNKYLKLLEDKSDIYLVATALCPWFKLQWFRMTGYSDSTIQRVRELLYNQISEYTTRYGSAGDQGSINGVSLALATPTQPRRGRWIRDPAPVEYIASTSSSASPFVSLSAYLTAPPISEAEVERSGGLLKFWEHEEKAGSVLGRMALDILSAPSSSVDAERAFSGGRMAVNYRQHRTSITTFRAKMAVGTWFGTPLLSGPAEVLEILGGRGTTEPAPLDLD